jgi:lipoprotein NlpI
MEKAPQTAISDFSLSIALEPNILNSYFNRGLVYLDSKQFESAISDLSHFLDVQADNGFAYYYRGLAYRGNAEIEKAHQDISRALEQMEDSPGVWYILGSVKMELGDLSGALHCYTKLRELDKSDSRGYFYPGILHMMNQNWEAALDDLGRALDLEAQEYHRDYASFFIWVAMSRSGETGLADVQLEQYWESRWTGNPTEWRENIAAFLVGRVSEEELLDGTTPREEMESNGRYCEAAYYLGIKHLLEGDSERAEHYFRECLSTERRNFTETHLARAELSLFEAKD